jgi:hypothetical protein
MDVLAIFFILSVGFLLGYGVREIISQRRRAATRRYGERCIAIYRTMGPHPARPLAINRRHDGPRAVAGIRREDA